MVDSCAARAETVDSDWWMREMMLCRSVRYLSSVTVTWSMSSSRKVSGTNVDKRALLEQLVELIVLAWRLLKCLLLLQLLVDDRLGWQLLNGRPGPAAKRPELFNGAPAAERRPNTSRASGRCPDAFLSGREETPPGCTDGACARHFHARRGTKHYARPGDAAADEALVGCLDSPERRRRR